MVWFSLLAVDPSPAASAVPAAAAAGNDWPAVFVALLAFLGGGIAAILTGLGNYQKDRAIAKASELSARHSAEKSEVETEQARAELAAAAFGAMSREVESWVSRVLAAKDAQIVTLQEQLQHCQDRLDRCQACVPHPEDPPTGTTNRGQHPWPPGWRPPGS